MPKRLWQQQRTRGLLLCLPVVVLLVLGRPHAAWAQAGGSGGPSGTVLVYPPGWNLVSFGSNPGISGAVVTRLQTLYTLQANDTAYQTTVPQRLTPGIGYWAYFSQPEVIAGILPTPATAASTTTVPAGQCVLVGNPSTAGSVRVQGANRVYTFSPQLNTYVEGALVGIGRGAWACNDGTSSTVVQVEFVGDVVAPTWPDCCAPTPYTGAGKAQVRIVNDSPYPVTLGLWQLDPRGNTSADGSYEYYYWAGCATCPEYAPAQHQSCSADAALNTATVVPGRYVLHLQSEGADVADVQQTVELRANTSYTLCYFVAANRPRFRGS